MWLTKGRALVSFKHRYSDLLDSLATKDNQQKGEGPQASVFSNIWYSLTTKRNRQKGEGPQSASSIDILQTFDSLTTKCNRQKGESPLASSNINILLIKKCGLRTQPQTSILFKSCQFFCWYCKFMKFGLVLLVFYLAPFLQVAWGCHKYSIINC